MKRAIRPTLVMLFVGVVVAGTWLPARAAATLADASDDVAQARSHYGRGLSLFNEGKFTEARSELERAYAKAPTYRVLDELALTCESQGDRAAAIHYAQRYLAEGNSELSGEERARAEALLARLRSRVALVTLRTRPSGEASVAIDEVPLGQVPAAPLVLLPGARKIWVTRAGYYPWTQTILLEEGGAIELVADLKELPQSSARRPPWSARLWYAGGAALLLTAIGFIAWRLRSRRPTVATLDDFNPYRSRDDTRPPQPTPAQTRVIIVDSNDLAAAEAPLVVSAGVATDVGQVKLSNDDSHLVDARKGLFVVADGIGGFAGGGVASATAVEAIAAHIERKADIDALSHLPALAARLVSAVYAANAIIRRKQIATPNLADMGTTCVAARLSHDARDLFIVHVGDSRAYRLRAGALEQLTTDHTMAELGITGRRAQHLSRALGSEAMPKLDVLVLRPKANDIYLLCCDGLTKMLDDDILRASLVPVSNGASAEDAASALVAKANAAGGLDNITALVLKVSVAR